MHESLEIDVDCASKQPLRGDTPLEQACLATDFPDGCLIDERTGTIQ